MSLTIERRALEWVSGDDTGTSSMTIFRQMLGLPHNGAFGIDEPSDGGDLGRCCRLLELIPEWYPRISEMKILSNAWDALIPHWYELTKLLESETGPGFNIVISAPKTYKRIQEITSAARKPDGWIEFGKGTSFRMKRAAQ